MRRSIPSRAGFLCASLAVASLAPSASADTTLRIATLAPEGSSWMKLFHAWQGRVEQRTDGRVKIKFFAGAVQGDEKDMLKKIRLGQLSGAAITGIGLSVIAPEARAVEIARTYEQLDGLRGALGADIRKRFEEKGFVVGAWGDVGPVYLFSAQPVRTLEDLRQVKLWLWSDDPVSRQLFAELKLNGVPMGVPDVLPGLSTGQINGFFGAPLSTVALQWASHAKYMCSLNVSQATGATVIAKKAWDTIAPADQAILREESDAMQSEVLRQVRGDNDKALETMKKKGLTLVEASPELRRELDRALEAVAKANAGQVSAEFQGKVQALVDAWRATHTSP